MTADMLRPLTVDGWIVLHDRALPGSRANLDHVLVPPAGRELLVGDTKRWHAQRATHLIGGRVHCGTQDRHAQVEAVARYAQRVAQTVDVPGGVQALVIVHGSPVAGNVLEVDTVHGPVTVVGAGLLVDWLRSYGQAGGWDREAAVRLAVRADQVFPRYGGGG